jgi:hypothetical protein
MELPEAKLIESEIVLREMHLTDDVAMTRKSLVRWLALALGIVSPRESRLSVLTILEAILYYHLKEKRGASYEDLVDYFKQQGVEMNEKTVRYHITQLRKAGVLEDDRGIYRFVNFHGEDLTEALEQSHRQRVNAAFYNIKQAIDTLKKMYEQ